MDGGFTIGLWALTLVALAAIVAPWLAPHPPNAQPDLVGGRLRAPGTTLHAVQLRDGRTWLADAVARTPEGLRILRGGTWTTRGVDEITNLTDDGVADRWRYWLGSDRFSRDLLSRLLHGARTSLLIAVLSIALALSLGLAVGAVAALAGGAVDALLMRIVDGLLTLPWLMVLITLSALVRPSTGTLIALLGASGWMGLSRIVRGEMRGLLQRDFVRAAVAMGAGRLYLLRRHLLPHVWTPVVISVTLALGSVILAEAALSFLGLGVPPTTPSWGGMIADGRLDMLRAWWVTTVPGAALVITVIAVNLVGDGLRDRLDPRRA